MKEKNNTDVHRPIIFAFIRIEPVEMIANACRVLAPRTSKIHSTLARTGINNAENPSPAPDGDDTGRPLEAWKSDKTMVHWEIVIESKISKIAFGCYRTVLIAGLPVSFTRTTATVRAARGPEWRFNRIFLTNRERRAASLREVIYIYKYNI